jgi:hypothetical protein
MFFCFVMYVSGGLGALWMLCGGESRERRSLEHSEVYRTFKECVLLCSSSLITMLLWYVQKRDIKSANVFLCATDYSLILFYKPLVRFIVRFQLRSVYDACSQSFVFNPLTPNDLKRRHAVSPLKIKIPIKNTCEKPTNTPIIHSVY